MYASMLGLLAETPVHPGSGRGLGVVDLPVAREAATGYPVIVGSSLKGALRDKAESASGDAAIHFGQPDRAGDLLVSDGRLLLLPVRSLTSSYRWATCPHLIERYNRDLTRAGLLPRSAVPAVERGTVLATGEDELYLEERQFSVTGSPDSLSEAIGPTILHDATRQRLDSQIALLHDDDFAWFARYGLAIQARIALEDDSRDQHQSLWYEETLPPDTVMYSLVMGRNKEATGALDALFPDEDPYLQAGGNETVGQGWFAVSVRKPETPGEGGTQ